MKQKDKEENLKKKHRKLERKLPTTLCARNKSERIKIQSEEEGRCLRQFHNT